ncbi:MAG: alkaline phosphatase family protein [Candidatus Thermoplasmatota archaeon]|nr:alkaline phosphatase family protein [Candidatus Thermoplasmatota archaeon]
MSSISGSFGVPSNYPALEELRSADLENHKNVVLLVIDGLGFRYLDSKESNSFLKRNLKTKITSVFPSSTASAIPTFLTGNAPQKHAITGWYMHLKEIGTVSTALHFAPRYGDRAFSEDGIDLQELLELDPIYEKFENSFIVTDEDIKESVLSKTTSAEAVTYGYEDMDSFTGSLERAVRASEERKYIYAYWPGFDSLAHEHGVSSTEVERHFQELDKKLKQFVEDIKDTDTMLMITSDHGFIDTTEEKSIRLKDHPEMEECLTLPMCGDYRSAYCYLRPSKDDRFRNYWEDELQDFCRLHEAQELIEKNYFGIHEPDPKLFDRIGDYVLIMKENYTMQHGYPNKDDPFMIGQHGGVTEKEMWTPLSVIEL